MSSNQNGQMDKCTCLPLSTIESLSANFAEVDLGNGESSPAQLKAQMALDANQSVKRRNGRELGNRGYVKKMRGIPFVGIFCAIMYAFFMSSSVALLKVVPRLHPLAVLVYRSIIQGLVFLGIAFYNEKSLFGVPGERYPVAGRAVSGMMNQVGWYMSVKYISLTDSSAIYYSAPVFVTVLAFFMLGEPFGFFECISVLITLVGVTLVSKPGFIPFFKETVLPPATVVVNNSSSLVSMASTVEAAIQPNNYHVMGMLFAFAGAITFALSNIYLRQMRKTPTEITAFWYAFFTIVSCIPIMLLLDLFTVPSTLLEWTIVGLCGVFATMGQVAFTLALKVEKAGPVSVAQTLNIVIVLFYQIVFFHEPVTMTSLIGVMLIIFSVMVIGFKDMLVNNRLILQLIKKFGKSSNGKFDVNGGNILTSKYNCEKQSLEKNNGLIGYGLSEKAGAKLRELTNANSFIVAGYCIGGNCKSGLCRGANQA